MFKCWLFIWNALQFPSNFTVIFARLHFWCFFDRTTWFRLFKVHNLRRLNGKNCIQQMLWLIFQSKTKYERKQKCISYFVSGAHRTYIHTHIIFHACINEPNLKIDVKSNLSCFFFSIWWYHLCEIPDLHSLHYSFIVWRFFFFFSVASFKSQ